MACSKEEALTLSVSRLSGSDGGLEKDRLMTILRRPLSGRNLGGMLSHVLRPMMTAFTAGGLVCTSMSLTSFVSGRTQTELTDGGNLFVILAK